MAIIDIKGEAEGMYSADTIELTITFRSKKADKSNAINNVLTDCENFLKRIKEAEIPMDSVECNDDSLRIESVEGIKTYKCSRKIKMVFPAQMKMANAFVKLLQIMDNELSYDLSYSILDKEEIRRDLLKKAFEDSKCKAEMLASLAGMKIIGIDKIDIGERYASGSFAKSIVVPDEYTIDVLLQGLDSVNTEISDTLNVPKYYKHESVNVKWRVE